MREPTSPHSGIKVPGRNPTSDRIAHAFDTHAFESPLHNATIT